MKMKTFLVAIGIAVNSCIAAHAYPAGVQSRFFFRVGDTLLTAPVTVTNNGNPLKTDFRALYSKAPADLSTVGGQILEILPHIDGETISFSGKFAFRDVQSKGASNQVTVSAIQSQEFPFSGSAKSGQAVTFSITTPDNKTYEFELTLTRVDDKGELIDKREESKFARK